MTTIVFHPKDPTTDFLKAVYEGKNYDVVTDGNIHPKAASKMIRQHDRVIMLGHGSNWGLFGSNMTMMIGQRNVPALQSVKEVVGIWCYASDFFNDHSIKGFATGMFCSDTDECAMYGMNGIKEKEVETSNTLFANIVGKFESDGVATLYDKVKEFYKAGDLMKWNLERIIEGKTQKCYETR